MGKDVIMKRNLVLTVLLLIVVVVVGCRKSKLILADKGNSLYRIVISHNPSEVIKKAAHELQLYLEKIADTKLPIVTDKELFKSEEIIIGQNDHLKYINFKFDQDQLAKGGFKIQTLGKTLILFGGSDSGTRNAVYSFLEEYLGCRMYTPDAIKIPKQKTIRLPQINDTQTPIFSYRETLHYFPLNSQEYCDWHKLHSRRDRMKNWGMYVHTFNRLVPPDEYFNEHPEYFSELNGYRIKDGQLCLSNPEVLKITITNLSKKIAENPNAQIWSVSQNDNYNYCCCEKCKPVDEKYDTHAGTVIEFVNKVAREFPDKTISTLAYQYSRKAPIGIVPEKNVNIMLCSIECDRSRPLEIMSSDSSFQKDLADWGKLTNNIWLWDYVVQFRNYLDPFPNLHVLQPNLQFFAKYNCAMMFQQGSGGSISEFHELRTYLIAKLLWDPNIDIDAVMDDFLNGYYGDAGPIIRKYIDKMHKALVESSEFLDIYGYPFNGINSYLTPSLMKEYEQLYDSAEQIVDGDSVLMKRVKRARLPLEFALLDIALHNVNSELTYLKQQNGKLIPREDMLDRVKLFVRDCQENGIKRLEEHGYPPEEFQSNVENLVQKCSRSNLAFGKPVTVLTEWSEKYPVGGGKALTDGIFGVMDYFYNWLGFENADLEAIVDLEEVTEIKKMSVDFMQYPLAWIFLPIKVEYFISTDGKTFSKAGSILNKTPQEKGKVFLQNFAAELEMVKTRYIKIKAESVKLCPDWHRGAGQPAWIFVDEIIVE